MENKEKVTGTSTYKRTTTTSSDDAKAKSTDRSASGERGEFKPQNRTWKGPNKNFQNFSRGPNRYPRRKKFCKLCAKGIEHVDYKDVDTLNRYLNHSLKIASRRITGACASHQKKVANAIKRARIVALIAFVKD